MEKSNKPEIPAKTFNIKTLKSVDKSSQNTIQKTDINSDLINEPKFTKQNECQDLAKNYETTVPNVDKLTVDEVFNKVFGKSVTISDKINEFITADESDRKPEEDSTPEDIYTDDRNPFDEEVVEKGNTKVVITKTKCQVYPDHKNPFGDEEEEEVENVEEVSHLSNNRVDQKRRSSDALNPFGDEDIYDQNNDNPKPKPRQSLNVSNSSSAVPSPTSSLRERKKRPAPTPPTPSTPSIQQESSSCSLNSSFIAVSGVSSRRDSIASCISSDFGSSVPNSRTPTPLPRLKLQKSTEEFAEDIQQISDKNSESCDQNLSLRSVDSDSEQRKRSTSDLRIKKRPAPPIPVVKRLVKGSLPEIEKELNTISDELPGVDKKSKELEEILIKRLESEGQRIDESDPLMADFLSTAKERYRLGRRQKELMYMKREHRLEEIQVDIEYQMRCVMSKQAAQKTEEDLKQEEELLKRLVEIIEERNDIVENMITDENKEIEEYRRLVSKVMPTLPTNIDSKDAKKGDKISKHKTRDKNFVKFKDKLKLKDIKEKKKLKKLEKSLEKSAEKSENSLEKSPEKSSDTNNSIHLTLKSTLKPFKKSLGLKSKDSDQKSDKKSDKKSSSTSSVISDHNDSNASISDNNLK